MRTTKAALLAVLASIAFAAPAHAQAQTDVVLYTTVADKEMQKITERFKAVRPDITVKWLRMVSSAIFSRFSGEEKSGVSNADIILSGSAQLFQERPDLFVEITEDVLKNRKNVERIKPKNASYVVVLVNPHLLAYNTKLVDEATASGKLKSWKDLADPIWKGKIGLLDPLATPNNMSWYLRMRQAYGDQYLRDLAANSAGFAASGAPAAQQTAVGAFAVTLPTTYSASAEIRESGAPLRVFKPEGPAHALETSLAIAKTAPHPAGARAFADWLISNDGQATLCTLGGLIPAAAVTAGGCLPLPVDHFGSVDSIPKEDQRQILDLLGRK